MFHVQFWYFNVNFLSIASVTSRSVRLSFLYYIARLFGGYIFVFGLYFSIRNTVDVNILSFFKCSRYQTER